MLNKLTLIRGTGGDEEVLATICAEVIKGGHTQVSIIEHCLAGCALTTIPNLNQVVTYAKQEYQIADITIFPFESFGETDVIHRNFSELLENHGHNLDKEDILAAAVFIDLLSEAIVDFEDGVEDGEIQLVSTLLTEYHDDAR